MSDDSLRVAVGWRNRVYPDLLSLHEIQQLFSTHLTVAQDLAEQLKPDGFPGMYRHHRVPAVRVAKEMVAAQSQNPRGQGRLSVQRR
jgi:hypothetical protein